MLTKPVHSVYWELLESPSEGKYSMSKEYRNAGVYAEMRDDVRAVMFILKMG